MMASPGLISKLSWSLPRITGLSTRLIPSCRAFSTNQLSDKDSEDDFQLDFMETDAETNQKEACPVLQPNAAAKSNRKPLQDAVEGGIYKAILLGEVGQLPVQKRLRSGRVVTMFSVGTGGIRNNRRPLESETPKEYADRSVVQWHRVAIYLENLGGIAMQHVKQGAHVYLEGNLETKIFSDPVTGLVKRIREIAIRRGGRLVFLDGGTSTANGGQPSLRGVGYF